MQINENITLNLNSFTPQPEINAQIDHITFNKNGIILYYTKQNDDRLYSYGASTINSMLEQWNRGML